MFLKKILLIFLFLFGFINIILGQELKKEKSNFIIELNSPRTTKIISLLIERNDIYNFCDNFYNFYYTEINDNKNVYHIVEKNFIKDSIMKYNAIKANSIDLKVELLGLNNNKKKIFIIPLR